MRSISELVEAYRNGQTTPTKYISELLQKVDELQDLNIFISIDQDQLMQAAYNAEVQLNNGSQLPLLGVPIAVKDLIDVAKMRSTMGSKIYANAPLAQIDALVVKKLRDAGAIIFGKANTHEFAYGSTGDVSVGGPAKNPVNPSKITGGSSSGSAAALAAGLSLGALGTDTSCSVRLPASFCGVVGLKPTYGLLPKTGIFPLSETLDHPGQLSLNIRDNAMLLDVLTDSQDLSYGRFIGTGIENTTVGVLSGSFFDDYLAEDIRNAMHQVEQKFAAAGARIIKVQISEIEEIYNAQQLIIKAEAYHVHEQNLLNGAAFHPEVRERLMGGADVSAVDYLKAIKYRKQAQAAFDDVLVQADILISPICGISPALQGERMTMLNGQSYSTPWLLTRLTAPTNLSMHPGLSVPFGRDSHGMPIGIHLVGRLNDEAKLYQYGAILERD